MLTRRNPRHRPARPGCVARAHRLVGTRVGFGPEADVTVSLREGPLGAKSGHGRNSLRASSVELSDLPVPLTYRSLRYGQREPPNIAASDSRYRNQFLLDRKQSCALHRRRILRPRSRRGYRSESDNQHRPARRDEPPFARNPRWQTGAPKRLQRIDQSRHPKTADRRSPRGFRHLPSNSSSPPLKSIFVRGPRDRIAPPNNDDANPDVSKFDDRKGPPSTLASPNSPEAIPSP